jgi:hypothetical protein
VLCYFNIVITKRNIICYMLFKHYDVKVLSCLHIVRMIFLLPSCFVFVTFLNLEIHVFTLISLF